MCLHLYRQRPDCFLSSSLSFWLLAVSHRSMRYPILVSRSFLVFSSSFSVTCLPVSPSSFVVLSSIRFCHLSVFVRWLLLSLFFRPSLPRHLDVHLLLISGWVHLSRTHAGFRWCASSIGSVSTVLLPCRQVLTLIVPPRLRYISSGRWR